jgi:hypothetical protein
MLESGQVAVLKAIEEKTGTPLSAQIRRAIDAYIREQTWLRKAEVNRLLQD